MIHHTIEPHGAAHTLYRTSDLQFPRVKLATISNASSKTLKEIPAALNRHAAEPPTLAQGSEVEPLTLSMPASTFQCIHSLLDSILHPATTYHPDQLAMAHAVITQDQFTAAAIKELIPPTDSLS